MPTYDAILVVSFGGPEGPDDVIPFLENVLRGKNVPKERMLEVAEHYQKYGGVSPINKQNRELIAALREELSAGGIDLPIYWGNRNWQPMLADTLAQMKADGVKHALAYFTSAFSSYSGCRQYRENIADAQENVGEGAPRVDKLRMFFNHPGYIEPVRENLSSALEALPEEVRDSAKILFTAHSIPMSMAENCRYEEQLNNACGLVAEDFPQTWELVYQSRSGPPTQPWLEPDVCDRIRELAEEGLQAVVVVPIGFVSDHMEVIYDLDEEAKETAEELGLPFARASTVGTNPRFVKMIRELIVERMTASTEKPYLGEYGASHDVCPKDCCTYTPRRPV
jgi:ferrochelatase